QMASRAVTAASTALRELRIHVCQKSAASSGVRDFITKQYAPLKKANPNLPILVRECSGISPRVFARYEFGVERFVSLENLPEDKVAGVIRDLASKSH
ncbi:hypothetical protein PFISCL1PPCAC_744, partial [Pristionchus fissidentatus]